MNVPSTDPNVVLENPVWLVLYHELGGHAFLKYIKLDYYQDYNTIIYENALRAFHNMGERAEDPEHPYIFRK